MGGSFDLAAFNVGVTSVVRLGDIEGHVSISSEACTAEIGDVNINFHGGARWDVNCSIIEMERCVCDIERDMIIISRNFSLLTVSSFSHLWTVLRVVSKVKY